MLLAHVLTTIFGATVPENRYLLYDTIFHEQVNKQRRALMFYLNLAMRLDRTLVLPRTRLLRSQGYGRFDPNADYVAWGELFNISTINSLHPAIEVDQFLEQYLDSQASVALHVKIDHKGCAETGEGLVPFNGMEVTAARSVCASGWQYDYKRLAGDDFVALESLAFSNSVDQLDLRLSLKLRPYVRFVDSIYDKARAFATQHFGDRPFLAIHWRRTDFLLVRKTQAGVLQSATDLVRHARRVMKKHGIDQVYLATDSTDEAELATVRDALQPHRYAVATATLRQRAEMANVEIAICAMAARFLGTKTSSFTLAISEERSAVFRRASDTTDEMDALPPPTEEPEPSQARRAVPTSPPSPPPLAKASATRPCPPPPSWPTPTTSPAGPSAPRSPVESIRGRQRFLLFDVSPHEQVNKQRRAVMFYLDLAMRLKRTLVLPRLRLLQPSGEPLAFDASKTQYVRWHELFDLGQLSKLHPVVDFETFLHFLSLKERESAGISNAVALHVKVDHQGCAETGEGLVPFNGKLIAAARSVCASGWQYDAARLSNKDFDVLESLAFSNSIDQLGLVQASKLRPYVRFVDSIYDKARAFVSEHFGDRPFLAIHWRRTDFLLVRKTQAGVLQSATDLVRHARRVMKKHGIDQVYLATDSTDEAELATVRDALQPQRFSMPVPSLVERTEMANVEIAICAMAARFLGTKTSSFTLTISEERAIRGHASGTTSEMDALPVPKSVGDNAKKRTPPQPRGRGPNTVKKDEL